MDTFDFDVDDRLRPAVERKLIGTTRLDLRVGELPRVGLSTSVNFVVLVLRGYRSIAPRWIRERCVFDPSCSHYSELAFRQFGVRQGILLTARRLRRCKSGAGGIDLIPLEIGDEDEVQS